MTQPLDRGCRLPPLGKIDRDAGEFWEENPFLLFQKAQNLSSYERNRLFLNDGGQSFVDASLASGTDLDSDSRSAIPCDFDRDGAVDLLVGSVGGGPLRLFRNRWPRDHHRVALQLVGSDSNQPAIGARVVVDCGGRQIVRDLFPANGFMGMAPPELLIGLGEAERIERLQVRWPSGLEQTFLDLPVDARLTLVEGNQRVQRSALGS